MKKPVILVVDDEQPMLDTLRLLLKGEFEVVTATDGRKAVETVRSKHVDLVLMDINLPVIDGIKALELIKEVDAEVGVVMLSAMDSAHKAVSALKLGAYDYITKPFEVEDLLSTIKRYIDKVKLKKEVEFLKEELQSSSGNTEIISASPKMKKVFDLIKAVSAASSSVLITGESGTGKELVARAIHAMGERKDKPFVAVNCGAVPSDLMETELFGHEKGSFTGAHVKKIGKFEYADGGTVFLDEISTMPMHLQIKLLRALQERTFERVGGNEPIKVDIRVMAATNVDLEKEVRRGSFREDLYYRLKVVPIDLPPLRERREDIPLLVEYFLEKHGRKCNKKIPGVTPEVIDTLKVYSWPGNIRELENLVERFVVLGQDGVEITADDLPTGFLMAGYKGREESKDFKEACKAFERHYILNVLKKTGWNRVETARELNIHRNTLLTKMKELGLREPWLLDE